MKPTLLLAFSLLLVLAGCGPQTRSRRSGSDPKSDAELETLEMQSQEFNAQLTKGRKLLERYDNQLKKMEEQSKRYDALLETAEVHARQYDELIAAWEEQTQRHAALLERWESQNPPQ